MKECIKNTRMDHSDEIWRELQQVAERVCAENNWRFSSLSPPATQFSVVRHDTQRILSVVANYTPESGVLFLHFEQNDRSVTAPIGFVLRPDGSIQRQYDSLQVRLEEVMAHVTAFFRKEN